MRPLANFAAASLRLRRHPLYRALRVDKTTLAMRTVAARTYGCTVPIIEHLAAVGGTLWMTQRNAIRAQSGCTDPPFYSIEALNELQTKCAMDVARVLSGEKAVYPISA